MGYRSLLLLISLVLVGQSLALTQDKNDHPGTIVDDVTGKGILAGAYAYGSDEQVGNAACPKYKERLDGQQSQAGTGSFVFHIIKAKSSYIAVYCQDGYQSRKEDKNDNSEDGTRVQPDPVSLHPSRPKLASSQIDPADAAYVAVARVLDRARADVLYLSTSDEGGFYKALDRFPQQDQNILKMLRDRKPTGVLVNPLHFPSKR
jgi:hypothetical protein